MKQTIIFLAFLFSGFYATAQESPKAGSGIESLYDREIVFSKNCAAKGQHLTTYESMARDGILFRPGPIKAKEVLKSQNPSPNILKTYPLHVDVSASEDFGFVQGVYEFQTNMPLSGAIDYGFFCTVWEKNVNEEWKVVIAQAISTGSEKPNLTMDLTFPVGADQPRTYDKNKSKGQVEKELMSIDRQLSDVWNSRNQPASFMKFLAEDGKIYRNRMMPVFNRIRIRDIVQTSKMIDLKPIGARVAASGDIGYTYGSFKIHKSKPELGYYLRVWKIQNDGSWKIVVDVSKNPQGKVD